MSHVQNVPKNCALVWEQQMDHGTSIIATKWKKCVAKCIYKDTMHCELAVTIAGRNCKPRCKAAFICEFWSVMPLENSVGSTPLHVLHFGCSLGHYLAVRRRDEIALRRIWGRCVTKCICKDITHCELTVTIAVRHCKPRCKAAFKG